VINVVGITRTQRRPEPFCGLGDHTCKHELKLKQEHGSSGINSLDWRTLRKFLKVTTGKGVKNL